MHKEFTDIFEKVFQQIKELYPFVENYPSVIAFSGGKDSRLVLELYNFLSNAYKIPKPHVFHLAHNIRDTKEEKIEIFNFLNNSYSNSYKFISRDIPRISIKIKKSLEETGRIIRLKHAHRYATLINGYVTTGHHTMDYFETLMINLIRGGGRSSLNSMPTWNGSIFRPLTLFTDTELDKCYELIQKFPIWEDETNQSDAYLRNRVRKKILPFLKEEGLSFAKLFKNLQEDTDLFSDPNSKSSIEIPSYLTIPNNTLDCLMHPNDWKKLLDTHFTLLKLSPVRRSTVFETYANIKTNKSFEYKTNQFTISKQKSGPLILIPKNSPSWKVFSFSINLPKISVEWNSQKWEGELPSFLSSYSEYEIRKLISVDSIQPGSKIQVGTFQKEISEILRENFIPRSLRTHIPILHWKGIPRLILLSLWNPELNNVPKSWETEELR
jgi:tRNA(Ile)-lysidine synthase